MPTLILRTLDKKIRTAWVPPEALGEDADFRDIDPEYISNGLVFLFEGRAFTYSYDREYDPCWVEQTTVTLESIRVPTTRPAPTSGYEEPDEEYSI